MRPPPARTLSDRAVAAWRVDGVRISLFQGLVVVALLAVALRDAVLVAVLGGVELAVVAALLVVVAPRVYARTWRYEVDEHELYLQKGWVTITRHVVPLIRIQNVDTVQGPIDKLFGLSSVTLATAGGKVTVVHLDEPVAEELRTRIAERVRKARARVDAIDAGGAGRSGPDIAPETRS